MFLQKKCIIFHVLTDLSFEFQHDLYYAILDGQYRKPSDINTVTVDIGLYFCRGALAPRQKYSPISRNIVRGKAECNISRYQSRKSSQVKYPTHPEGRLKAACGPGPRDVWDISRGMISEIDIAR